MKQSMLFLLILSACAVAGHTQVRNAQVPTHFVTSSDDTLIAVHESGPSCGKPIVFVHGFSANGNVWFQQQQLILEDISYRAPLFVRQNYVNGVGAAITTNFGALLTSLTVPVLLQRSQNDPIFPQALLIPLEAALIKHPTVKLYETGWHIPFILG